MFDETKLNEAYGALHASENTFAEVMNMTNQTPTQPKRHTVRRSMVIALAAMLVLSIAVSAAYYGFGLNRRAAEPGERFRIDWDEGDLYWEDAKLVFEFSGEEECNAVHFKPGWLPREIEQPYFCLRDGDGWYTRLSGESAETLDQPYLIETYYAPQFVDGGHMILLYYQPDEIIDETWGDYQIMKFTAHQTVPGTEYREEMVLEKSYYIMYQPQEGHIIVVSGSSDVETLEKIGQDLTIETTDEIVSAADYHEYNVFVDGGMG